MSLGQLYIFQSENSGFFVRKSSVVLWPLATRATSSVIEEEVLIMAAFVPGII